MIKYLISQTL